MRSNLAAFFLKKNGPNRFAYDCSRLLTTASLEAHDHLSAFSVRYEQPFAHDDYDRSSQLMGRFVQIGVFPTPRPTLTISTSQGSADSMEGEFARAIEFTGAHPTFATPLVV
jgi:hypothetical protein